MNEWKNIWMENVWKKRINEWMSEWMKEWMKERMKEWMSEWVTEWVNEWVNKRMNEWINGWLNNRMSEWMREWTDEWRNKWMTEQPIEFAYGYWLLGFVKNCTYCPKCTYYYQLTAHFWDTGPQLFTKTFFLFSGKSRREWNSQLRVVFTSRTP